MQGGQYESVVYCSRCGEEISRTEVEIAPTEHTAGETKRVWLEGIEDSNGNITGPDCLDGGVYQDITYCSVCGDAMLYSEETYVDPPGHNWINSGGQVFCSNCGHAVVEAYYSNGSITYYLDSDYMNEKNISDQEIRLWSYDQNSYVDDMGYNWGSDNYSGTIDVPGQYADPGNRLRVDVTFSDGSVVRSNDVTVQ